MAKAFTILCALAAVLIFQPLWAAQTAVLQSDDIIVVYEPPLKAAAGEVLRIYPVHRQDLEDFFRWRLNTRPRVILVKTNQTFQKIAGNNLIVAFAVPDKKLIVFQDVNPAFQSQYHP